MLNYWDFWNFFLKLGLLISLSLVYRTMKMQKEVIDLNILLDKEWKMRGEKLVLK